MTTWNRANTVVPPAPFAGLLSRLQLLVAVLCPPSLLVAVPLALVWKPTARTRWRLLALIAGAATATGWWWWATRWHGGLQAVVTGYADRYVTTWLDARDAVLATRTLPSGEWWLAAVKETWPVWVPVGFLLAALYVLLGTADDGGGEADGLRSRRHAGGHGGTAGSPGSPGEARSLKGNVLPWGNGGMANATQAHRVERVAHGEEPPPRDWLIPRLVPYGPRPKRRWGWCWLPWWWETRGYVTAVLGSGGTGKSYLLLDLALASLWGQRWMGHPVKRQRSVLYVDAELDVETCRERAFALARGRGRARPPEGLHYLQLSASLATPEGIAVVAEAVRRHRVGLVLFDSLTIGARGLALSDADGWNAVLMAMETWGVPVVAIDHLGKDAGKGAVGSFMKQARVRSGLTLERRKDGAVAATHHKTNFGPTLEPFAILPRFDDGDGEGHPAISAFRALPSSPPPLALLPPTSPAPPPTVRADDRPALQQLPVREALHIVPPPVDGATDVPQGNRGHAEIDARVLAAFRAHGGAIVSKEDVALELGYGIKTVHNACSRLKGKGLESPQPGQWRATTGAGAAQEVPA